MKSVLAAVVGVCILSFLVVSCFHSRMPSRGEGGNKAFSKVENVPKAYICITGQLPRLELVNKISTLLLPLHQRGFKLYIGLAINSAHARVHYTNNNNGDKMQLYTSINDAVRDLSNTAGVEEVKHIEVFHSGNLTINERYRVQLGNHTVNKFARASNHIRQYETLSACSRWKDALESSDVVVRIREDILIEYMNLSAILKQVYSGNIVASACDSWRGINDKMAFLPSIVAHDYFTLPHSEYSTFDAIVDNLNPESYYRYVYKKKNLSLVNSSFLSVTKAVTKRLTNSITHCVITGNRHGDDTSQSCSKDSIAPYQVECWKP